MKARLTAPALLPLLLASSLAWAETPAARFDGLARSVGPLCAAAPSTTCFDAAYAALDRDGDGGLVVGELAALQADLDAWLETHPDALTASERSYVMLGRFLVEAVGLQRLFASYDTNRDGVLSRDEARADIALDNRPLAHVVRDPAAVDWAAVRQRLGPFAAALPSLPP